MAEICKHSQLSRSCEKCQAAIDIKAAYFEGYQEGFYRANRTEPEYNKSGEGYAASDAKTNSESV